nr:hypothetical protein [Lautropia mirabilis]
MLKDIVPKDVVRGEGIARLAAGSCHHRSISGESAKSGRTQEMHQAVFFVDLDTDDLLSNLKGMMNDWKPCWDGWRLLCRAGEFHGAQYDNGAWDVSLGTIVTSHGRVSSFFR